MDLLEKNKKYFTAVTITLIVMGLVMVLSASYMFSKETFGTSTHFFFKQLFYVVIGSGVAFGLSKTKMGFWYKNIYLLNGLAFFLLLLTMTPLGISIKGSQRWLGIGGVSFQPGEFVKYSICLTAIYYFNHYFTYTVKERFVNALHFLFPLGLLLVQPDFGTFSISAILIAFACFLSDFPRKYFWSLMVSGIIAGGALLVAAPYRVRRLLVFLDPWSDPQNSGFQIIQSYLAFANGHIFGQGIGNSNEKLFYLPEAHNDFILSVIGEELGFVGILAIVLLFCAFTFFGFKLSLFPRAKVNKQIIACFVFAISMQACLNMGVVLGLLPTKGLNLPFISSGGTSLLANLLALGTIFACLSNKSQIITEEPTEVYTQKGIS